MLNKIIRFSLDNRMAIVVVAILLMAAGIYTARTTDVDVFPDLNATTVVVMTEARGMAPEEVERLVTFPIETAVNGATDVRRVRSSSTTGFSVVWVEFGWNTDIYRARQIVSEKIAAVGESLPEGVGNPTLGPQSSILGEVMIIGLTSESTSTEELRTIADWTLRPTLLATGGVAQVAVLGGDQREYQIRLDPELMRLAGVTLAEVEEAVDGINRNSSGGIIYQWGNEYIVRGEVSTNDMEAIASSVVAFTPDGHPIVLGDVASVGTGAKTPLMGKASVNAEDAVILTVTKQPSTSTKKLTLRLDERLAELQKVLPSDVEIHSDIFRQSRFIDASIDNIAKSLYEGGIFVVIILFLFLMNVRTTLISLVSIPLSLLITIIVLRLSGMTINTMSIGGMAIAIGSLVDDAIVDVENVYKHLRQNRLLPEGKRQPIREVVFEASREVRLPILNSTFIIVVSFIPLFFLSGMEGRMLVPLGVAFIVSLFASTCVALTLTPVLCSYLLGGSKHKEKADREPVVVRLLKGGYENALGWTLRHKAAVLSVAGALLIGSIALCTSFGRNFMPPFNEGSFTINVSTLPGASLEESDRIGQMAEELLLTVPEIQKVARKTGRAELDEHALGVNTSEIEAPFTLGKRRKDVVTSEIREKLNSLPGVNIEIGQPISHRIDAMLSGTQANIAIKIFGSNLGEMYAIGKQVEALSRGIEGVADLNVEQQIERQQLRITPRREMMASYGLTAGELNDFIEVMLEGRVVSQVYEGNRVFDLTLKADDKARYTAEAIRQMPVDTRSGKVTLETVADVESTMGPNTINRENVQRKIVVSANVAGRDLRSTVDEIRSAVDQNIVLPEDYRIEYGGQFESEERASRTLLLASAFAIVIIFMLLYSQFHNATQSAVVLLNLPLALIGGVVAIYFSDRTISIPAIIGFISLFGIATRNGMLLVDRYNALRQEGRSLEESIIGGSVDRLNPIIMTALTSALALIPLAVGGSLPGNEIQSPMAKVILGGLLSSTLLNGFIIPIMYSFIGRKAPQNVKL
ncbi:MAG: efflux RND transporter permease subunit [Tidjanibacter sp.]|nr:efflux RND transporter permease subunit [Tidjanibacter sp.]